MGKNHRGKRSTKTISAKKACDRAIKDVCQSINRMIRDRMEVGYFNACYAFRTGNGATEDIVKKIVSIYTSRGFEAEYAADPNKKASLYMLEIKWANV